MEGDTEFFSITKRIHNRLHGVAGDEGDLGRRELSHFERVSEENVQALSGAIRAGDLVLLHDPQTAGLVDALDELGAIAVWRCHVGSDVTNHWTEQAWDFLRPFLEPCRALVFSRASFAPEWADPSRVMVIEPSIDPFSHKNRRMSAHYVHRRMASLGLLTDARVGSERQPGSRPGTSTVVRGGAGLDPDTPLVVQVSRWDRLKDMRGVMLGFAESKALRSQAHLALVGPAVEGVADDPEGAAVLAECVDTWEGLPAPTRGRVHLISLDMSDVDENASMVNAFQRFASVIVQKSLAEGFGLTVVEGMWKMRAVVASAVGGIVDQISDGTGLLLEDPHDLDLFGRDVAELLADPQLRARIGRRARERVRDCFIGDRHLLAYAQLFQKVIKG
jgi:trehalose synthase